MRVIDLRSDTVTKPTRAMRDAMAAAEVGDDVYKDDPTVNKLEALAAEMCGTQSALFVPSGTQSNLLALLCHCQRGDEYIAGQEAHTYKFEAGGGAVLGSIQPQPIEYEPDGTLDFDKVMEVIKPSDDFHYARTKLLCLENTHNGKVLPLDYLEQFSRFASKHSLRTHLDGARVFNASVQQHIPVSAITRHFDSISICLSKGLGAPVGSLLCSTKEVISEASRWRKMLGGGMRQAGIIAAAGIVALTEHVERLKEDHDNAQLLAAGLQHIDELEIDTNSLQTNMVFVSVDALKAEKLRLYLEQRNILIMPMRSIIRFVTHLDISQDDIKRVVEEIKNFFIKE